MSSSGLIYAVIVGAWAAYLVPMWLRRQDELNEARPTERFSTAIRLLSGRAAMERRYAKELQQRDSEHADGTDGTEPSDSDTSSADPATDSVDVRAFAEPGSRGERSAAREQPRQQVKAQVRDQQVRGHQAREQVAREQVAREHVVREQAVREAVRDQHREPVGEQLAHDQQAPRDQQPARDQQPPRDQSRRARPATPAPQSPASAERARRTKVLARRRRTTVMLFAAFTLGAIVAGVGGLHYLWAPGIPAVLLSAYIVHLRGQEKRRFAFTMDRQRAELAAQRLREQRTQQVRRPTPQQQSAAPDQHYRAESDERPEPEPAPALSPQEAGRRALVEQTDHAEWVDQQRERERGGVRGDSWEPVPVPLPTYVTAPVAPRATGDLDLGAPGTWSSARSSTADPMASAADAPGSSSSSPSGSAARQRPQAGRRSRDRGRTPLFDQYDEGERPRAANE
ncbi:gephyrin-like molybdotransferase receptor GlpR [Streptomyces sp. NPDC051561]|uniref:gephyrin-like molybdotransferase receptor GlpR n=1 Tax=Streptomyces sp. NPDC051561 TaxID=3365658 RepID=UPI00378C7856